MIKIRNRALVYCDQRTVMHIHDKHQQSLFFVVKNLELTQIKCTQGYFDIPLFFFLNTYFRIIIHQAFEIIVSIFKQMLTRYSLIKQQNLQLRRYCLKLFFFENVYQNSFSINSVPNRGQIRNFSCQAESFDTFSHTLSHVSWDNYSVTISWHHHCLNSFWLVFNL